jgi:hypothetical protein
VDAGSPSPFRRHSDDTTPIQRKVTHDYILRIREAMRRVMEELNIAPPEPHSGAVWAAAINLMYGSISLNELTPERMRAYGPLSAEAADRLDAIRAELDGLVAKLRNYLGKGAAGDLQQRLQQLGKTGDEIRLLSEIERIITAHGLLEFRGTLSMLLDRMENAAFEVGVFGRVSSGKSSLLNYILQTDVLPMGSRRSRQSPHASATGLSHRRELNSPKRNRKSFHYRSCLNLRLNRKILETKSMSPASSLNCRPTALRKESRSLIHLASAHSRLPARKKPSHICRAAILASC